MSHIALQTAVKSQVKVSQAAALVRIYCRQTGKPYPLGSREFISAWKRYNIKATFQN